MNTNRTEDQRLKAAILKAADWIESHPEQYWYAENRVPKCGTQGCALGWIGHFLRLKNGDSIHEVVIPRLGLKSLTDFSIDRMDQLVGVCSEWREDAGECARALRLYAEEYCS